MVLTEILSITIDIADRLSEISMKSIFSPFPIDLKD